MDGMRLLPASSEGFRRLALVLALFTAPVLFARWFSAEAKDTQLGYSVCSENYTDQVRNCTVDEPDCRTTLRSQEDACFRANQAPLVDHVKTWGLFVFGALLGAYFVALIVRTFGWVVQGFQKTAL